MDTDHRNEFVQVFQFQYGSIKSQTSDRLQTLTTSFNSNMVQLRVYDSKSKTWKQAGFNSNMVQLRVAPV